ncbi:MAG: hypothetical protein K6C94_03625 [Candidatus Gastranaerophilales bacterium]|nr:hypothetical protein [Candidatus Gastranaerophilales bacterium]
MKYFVILAYVLIAVCFVCLYTANKSVGRYQMVSQNMIRGDSNLRSDSFILDSKTGKMQHIVYDKNSSSFVLKPIYGSGF